MRYFRAALAAFFIALIPLAAHAQGAVQQLGPVVNGHLGMWMGNAKLGDAGGSPGAGLQPVNPTSAAILPTGLGVLNSGLGYCQFSGPASAAYLQFCWGFSGNNALITLSKVGGGSIGGLNIQINGTTYPFPGNGQGNVLGPTSPATVVGHVVTWNNTSGTLLADGGGPPVLGPATSTINEFPVWANTSGTLLENGLGVLITHSGGLTLTGGGLTVGGAMTVTGLASMQNISASGTLSAGGITSLGGTLFVSGASTLTGNTSIGGTLTVTNAGTFNAGFVVSGGSVTINVPTVIASTASVNSLGVTGNASVSGAFGVTAGTTLQGALVAEAAVQFLGLTTTPGGKQPICVDVSTGVLYLGSGGAC